MTYPGFKRTGVGSNGILECKVLSKNAHRTVGADTASQHDRAVDGQQVCIKLVVNQVGITYVGVVNDAASVSIPAIVRQDARQHEQERGRQ
jgi:hypothetical protein